MNHNEREKIYLPVYLLCIFICTVDVYWWSFALFKQWGFTHPLISSIYRYLYDMNLFTPAVKLKIIEFVGIFTICINKAGKKTDTEWWKIIAVTTAALVLFFLPHYTDAQYLLTSYAGFFGLVNGISLIGRKIGNAMMADNDPLETFEQCEKKIPTDYSINIPTEYQYKKKKHKGWINIVNPFRGSIVMGTPGSGKSYSFFWAAIEQQIEKGFTMVCYDYKMPDLTNIVYNEYLRNKEVYKEKYGKDVQFCIVNFDNPRQSMRCNPLNARYLTDMSDAHEVADLIMKNVDPSAIGDGGDDFFKSSAKVYIASLTWLLKKHRGGIYCSFPHLIELMGKNYEAVLEILAKDEQLTIMAQPFIDAMAGGAQEQLQGQIASARIPLLKFPSPALYWVLTGDDFTLDINNPDAPKIFCMGNNPDRQTIYGAALALYTSRLFKVINHKLSPSGKRNLPCGVLLDEFPTIFIKGIDNLIATARSNRVGVFLGAQDISQIERDYKRENAKVVFNTVGNIFSGQVNGDTADHMEKTFGEEYWIQESQTTGSDSGDTISSSSQQHKILPRSRIETLTQGYFFGKVADDNDTPIEKKLFCGRVIVDVEERNRRQKKWQKIPNFGAKKYFKDEEIRQRIESASDDNCIRYLRDALMDEARQADRDGNGQGLSILTATSRARAQYNSLKDEEKAALLEKVIKEKQDAAVERTIKDNYDSIRQDIVNLFLDYNININDYESKAGRKGQQGQAAQPVSGILQGLPTGN